MDKDLVSVIMPTYNGSHFLVESIESVLNQTYRNLELVITDDGSTDAATLDILKLYEKKDNRVRVFFLEQNMGAGFARNHSLERAKGRYIAFCDSDDRWFPEKLEKQVSFLRKVNGCLAFSSYIICDQYNVNKGIVIAPSKVTLTMMKHDNKIGCLTAIYDTSVYGSFTMPTMRKRQDWAFFLKIMQKAGVAYGMREPLAYYRTRPHSISKNKFTLIKYNAKVYQTILGYSAFKSYCHLAFFFMPSYILKVIKKKIDSKRFLSV